MSRINNQLQHKISEITHLGQSKKEAQAEAREIYIKEHGNLQGYNISKTYSIRSINTAIAYRKSCEQFAIWLKNEKSTNKINLVTRELVGEYMKHRQDKGLSAWTLKKDLAAINKIFDFNLTSKELDLKERKLTNIKRSRSGPDKSRPGLIKKCREQIYLINACGCRRESVTKVKYNDIIFDENNIAIKIHLTEKGGKHRLAPILDSHKKEFTSMIQKYENNYSNIFNDFDSHVEAHYYRHLYAKGLYNELCEKILPTTELYKGYRVEVLKEVSKALGHNRLNVVVNNYFY
jgi:integrase